MDDAAATTPAREAFLAAVRAAIDDGRFVRLVLAKPRMPTVADLRKVTARPLRLQDRPVVSFVQTHAARDVTHHRPPDDAVDAIRSWLAESFAHAHLMSTDGTLDWRVAKRGRETLSRGKAPSTVPAVPAAAHDRAKVRHVALDRPYLAALGVTDAERRLIPSMARKWKQIDKFVELLDHAIAAARLPSQVDRPVEVLDFGSGKGYLTFATHDHLRHTLGLAARVTGVELRRDMVELCNAAAAGIGADGLVFEEGDVGRRAAQPVDIMIALHACDTATDHAIHAGVRAGAAIIVCAPCCHKELRPQLLRPHPLAPVLRHGVHLGQHAEMLTDGLRAMLLDACGYDAQVFEFVALEHTAKNKMILAVRRTTPVRTSARAWHDIDALKQAYGIRVQCLETLLRADGRAETGGAADSADDSAAEAPVHEAGDTADGTAADTAAADRAIAAISRS